MRVLVTGAAGFIGSNLVDRLLDRGDDVVGLDNFDPLYSRHEKATNLKGALHDQRFRFIEGDVRDSRALRSALAGPQTHVVVHLAAKAGIRPSFGNPESYRDVNVMGTQALLDVVAEKSVPGLVYASSSSVYGNGCALPFSEAETALEPISPYAETKLAAERQCRTYHGQFGGSVFCLRFFTAYGPRQRPDLAIRKFCQLIARGQPVPIFGNGTSERDYTWVDDIVDGTIAAIDRSVRVEGEFEIVNLGTGRSVSLLKLVELLGETLDQEPVLERAAAHSGEVTRTRADITRAQRLFGYRPRTSIREGIAQFVDWFLKSPEAGFSRDFRATADSPDPAITP